jgi:integrase
MATIVKARQRADTAGSGTRKPWTVRYQLDGRQRERSFRTKREAEDFKTRFEHESRELSYVDPKLGNERFADAAERWLSRHPGVQSTKAAYRSILTHHVNPVLGDRPLRSVAADRDGVQTLLLDTLPGKGLGRGMVRHAYQVIGAVVNDAIKAGRLSSSRLRGITLPAVSERAKFVFPSHTQLETLVAKLPEEYRLTVWLMRGCGLRIAEALAVHQDCFINGTLRLSQQQLRDKSYGPLKHRKAEDFRDVPVPAYVAEKAAAAPVRPDGYYFTPIVHNSYTRWFNAGRDAAGISGSFTPHSLRHVFASVSLSNGVPITDVAKWLGHTNIQITYRIYGHLVPSSWDAAKAALDREYDSWRDG